MSENGHKPSAADLIEKLVAKIREQEPTLREPEPPSEEVLDHFKEVGKSLFEISELDRLYEADAADKDD